MRSAQLFALGPQTVEVAIGQAEVLKVFRLRGLVRVLLQHARERETEGEQESLPPFSSLSHRLVLLLTCA